ncbi:MAG: Hsp20/alpha crystallin family protein [Pseudomonadota bacterium]
MDFRSLIPFHSHRRIEEWDPFQQFERAFPPLYEDFRKGQLNPFKWSAGTRFVGPRIDVSETDTELTVTAELPGMEENDVEISLINNTLTLRGEKKIDREEKKKDFHLVERASGSFARSFQIPFEVTAKQIDATFEKGVLTIAIPKPAGESQKTQKVPIKQGK